MVNLNRTLKVKHLLTEEVTAETVKTLAEGVIEITKHTDFRPSNFEKALKLIEVDVEAAGLMVNLAMDNLYDWADNNHVWIE